MAIEYDDFIDFCKKLIGKQISTIGKRSNFTVVSVNADRIGYKLSTGKQRYTERVRIQKVLDTYENTHSLKVVDYNSFTMASSYTLSLVKLYLEK
jgi:hypothetical protein